MFYVYILADRKLGTLYVGVTNDLALRIDQHRSGMGSKFVMRHSVFRLVHVRPFDYVFDAIAQEKRLKKWRRSWKVALIEAENSDWRDLYAELLA